MSYFRFKNNKNLKLILENQIKILKNCLKNI
jgi:hypothetical protein